MKDKTSRLVKLEAFMNESKNYIKLMEKQKSSIDKLLKESMIGYKDSMFKIDHVFKTFSKEIELVKKCHGQDFDNLSNAIDNAKEPLKHILERTTKESESIMKELDRTQKNNRSLIDDYLKTVNESSNNNPQVNLFCTMANEFNSTYYNQPSQRSVYLPQVCGSAMTTSVGGDDTSINDIFRNTVSSFNGYNKSDVKVKLKHTVSASKLGCRQVKSVNRNDRYKASPRRTKNNFADVKEKINEGRYL